MKRVACITFTIMAVLFLIASTSTGEPVYKKSINAPPSKKEEIFKSMITTSGNACRGKITEYMFMGSDEKQNGFCTVACADGNNYIMQVKNDAKGTTRILFCEMAEVVGISCWEKLD